jgi:hypothetical protein
MDLVVCREIEENDLQCGRIKYLISWYLVGIP